jgi:hypothetical protein|tara:strand:+ start:252 stop:590 length:339 start_codon:yes stop_codon:yes gene_type:complete
MNPTQFANDTTYIVAGAFSADLLGPSIDAGAFRSVSFTVVNNGTNTPVGNLYVQGSDDNSTFVNITSAVAVSGAENNILQTDELTSRYTRLFWDYASGGATSLVSASYTLKS